VEKWLTKNSPAAQDNNKKVKETSSRKTGFKCMMENERIKIFAYILHHSKMLILVHGNVFLVKFSA